jgi:ferredoxin/flavodoxin---NADP+ reductase
MSYYTTERILDVYHWDAKLFSFRCTRPPELKFENGQFVLIGLMIDGKPLMRAYSFVNDQADTELEFLSIKVPDGALTSRLSLIKPGDDILIAKAAKGTLVLPDLKPGKRLFLLATGTGLAPFISILRSRQVFCQFEQVVLMHGVRQISELAYRDELESMARDVPLIYYPTVTREPFKHQGRIPEILRSGQLIGDTGIEPFLSVTDRWMICGNKLMLSDTVSLLDQMGLQKSSKRGELGDYLIEQAFAVSKTV